MRWVRPPLAKVAFASATVYAIAATVELTAPAHLSTESVSWLVNPWLGAYTHTFQPASLPEAALSIGNAGVLLILVAFYLNHCVWDQPPWAVFGGWATMLSGATMLQLQTAFGAWWVSVDFNHSGFPLAYCLMVVGTVVVGVSWLVEPSLFNPTLSRPWVAAIIVTVLVFTFGQSAMNAPPLVVNLAFMIAIGAGLIAGSRAEARRLASTESRSGPPVEATPPRIAQ